ncbi:MAG: amidohydrolase family protein, partial [Chloroflexota bacterium]|nr:amidohydrolase family protein [Chloroflexota bacterium]
MSQDRGRFKLIVAGRLIDGSGGPPQERMAVLVEGDTIRAVGRQGQVRAPEGASVELFDFSDKTVLPGLVDGHTHINGFGDGRYGDDLAKCPDDILLLQSARNARVSLRAGVTTVRENGAKGRTTFSLKEAVRLGICEGPR